jgi:hypothetical protein
MIPKKPARGLDPRVGIGFSEKIVRRQKEISMILIQQD